MVDPVLQSRRFRVEYTQRVIADLESRQRGNPANKALQSGNWVPVPKAILTGPLVPGAAPLVP